VLEKAGIVGVAVNKQTVQGVEQTPPVFSIIEKPFSDA
jgi:hypothetical protein